MFRSRDRWGRSLEYEGQVIRTELLKIVITDGRPQDLCFKASITT